MEDEKTLHLMMSTLSHFFDEFIDRVQTLAEAQNLSEFKNNPNETTLNMMKQAMSNLEKDLEIVIQDMKEQKTIDITDLVKMIEDTVNKGGNNGDGNNGGLH